MYRDAPSSAFQLQTLPDDESNAAAVSTTLPIFGAKVLKHLQLLVLRYLVWGRDVFACFSTGFGNSLIFRVLTFVCSLLTANGFQRYSRNNLVLVVLPLKPVMKDLVAFF